MSLPMARSVSPGSSFLTRRSLPILMAGIFSMGLQADVFDTRRYSATCGTSMRPSGRSYVSDVEEAADPRISAPAFSRLSASLPDIPVRAGGSVEKDGVSRGGAPGHTPDEHTRRRQNPKPSPYPMPPPSCPQAPGSPLWPAWPRGEAPVRAPRLAGWARACPRRARPSCPRRSSVTRPTPRPART